MRPTCEKCLYWEKTDNEYANGTCHQKPPIVLHLEGVNLKVGFVPLPNRKWCGEYINKYTFETFKEVMQSARKMEKEGRK